MKFTERNLKQALKPKTSRYEKVDDTGLSAIVRPNGSISWQIRYMLAGKRHWKTYGTVSLAEAREKMRKDRDLIAEGVNPMESVKQKKAAEQIKPTVKVLLDTYYKEYLTKNLKRPEQPKQLIERYIIPDFGDCKVENISVGYFQSVNTNR